MMDRGSLIKEGIAEALPREVFIDKHGIRRYLNRLAEERPVHADFALDKDDKSVRINI